MSGDDTAMPPDDEIEATFELLRAAFGGMVDGPLTGTGGAPPAVLEGARWVHDWVNMDAELAQLTHDSSTDSELAMVRSGSPLRHITFECGEYEIEIEIEPSANGVSLTGTVSPPTQGTVQAVVGGLAHKGVIDELGVFLIDNINPGVVMAYISTDEGMIRLGSFEV